MPKSYNSNIIIANRSYTNKKICKLYEKQKLHPQTVRDWINIEGLQVLSSNPIIILGKDLKEFLKNRNSQKRKLAFNEFKCAKCKSIAEPHNKEISIYYNKNGSVRAVGICGVCPAEMQRFYKAEEEERVRKWFLIKPILSTLCNSAYTPLHTNIKTDGEVALNECEIVREDITTTERQTTLCNTSINLTSKTNIKKEQKPPRTALHTNINQEFQPSLF
ncbi:MAG: hypothetical protein ACI9CD_000729 [Candidatus Deianiraeaceae bacterium]|jgi:hypothetical protein